MSAQQTTPVAYTTYTNVGVIDEALRSQSRLFMIVGPKRCGKTTLVKSLTRGKTSILTLSDPTTTEEALINTLLGTTARHIVIDGAKRTTKVTDVLDTLMVARDIVVWEVRQGAYNTFRRDVDAYLVFQQAEKESVEQIHSNMKLAETDLTESAFAAMVRSLPGEYGALIVTPRQSHMSVVYGECE